MWLKTVGRVVTLALVLLTVPPAAEAQPRPKVPRIGLLWPGELGPSATAFRQGLRDLGYVEGQNMAIEYRYAEGKADRLPELAAELVRLNVDVLVASGPEAVLRAARDATRTIPIVMIAVDYDPIALGYIAGLPRPGGNITGVFLRQIEVTGKCLEILKDALPQLRRVAVLWDVHTADQFRAAEEAARGIGVQVHALALSNPPTYDFEGAFAAAAREGADALMVLRSPLFFAARARLTALAAQPRLPAMYGWRG